MQFSKVFLLSLCFGLWVLISQRSMGQNSTPIVFYTNLVHFMSHTTFSSMFCFLLCISFCDSTHKKKLVLFCFFLGLHCVCKPQIPLLLIFATLVHPWDKTLLLLLLTQTFIFFLLWFHPQKSSCFSLLPSELCVRISFCNFAPKHFGFYFSCISFCAFTLIIFCLCVFLVCFSIHALVCLCLCLFCIAWKVLFNNSWSFFMLLSFHQGVCQSMINLGNQLGFFLGTSLVYDFPP